MAKRFYCAREEGNAQAGNLLFNNELNTLPQKECDMKNWDCSNLAAHFSGVDVSPFIVAPDGSISRGIPLEGFENFILEHSENKNLADDKVRSPEVTRMIEKNVTEQALKQNFDKEHNVNQSNGEENNLSLEQELHKELEKQIEGGSSEPSAGDSASIDKADDFDTSGMDDKYVRQAKKVRERYLKSLSSHGY